MTSSSETLNPGSCPAMLTITTSEGASTIPCTRRKGHDEPYPVLDWAVCAICGGNRCKSWSWGFDHKFTPSIVGEAQEPHRFFMEWAS